MKSQEGGAREQAEERQLIEQAQAGDGEAFGVLYRRYLDPIYRYVYYRVAGAATAEDLTEEVFVRAWEALPGYEVTKYPFKSWLYRIAHNRVIDHRRKRRPAAIDDEVLGRIAAPGSAPEQVVAEEQTVGELLEAVRQLDEEEQQVVVLRFVEGLTHREVAEIIGKSEEASRVIQYRAIQRLQRVLTDQGRSR